MKTASSSAPGDNLHAQLGAARLSARLDLPDTPQLGLFAVAVILLHAILLTLANSLPEQANAPLPQIIDVTLDMSPAAQPPAALPQPAAPIEPPAKPAPPPAEPQPEDVPTPQPAPVAEAPAPLPPPAPPAPTQTSNEPPAPEIQPLSRLSRMPGFSRKVEAVYPPAERRAGVQANVLAEVTIDAQGNVLAVRILKSGGAAFDEAVKQALQHSLFSPGMMEGRAVGTRFQVPYRFALN